MIKHQLYSIISQSDDQEHSIASIMAKDQQKTFQQKQDQVYRMYKNILSKKQKQKHPRSLAKLTSQTNTDRYRTQTTQTQIKSFKRNITLDNSNKQRETSPVKYSQPKNDELISISSSNVVPSAKMKQKSTTNYSEGYKQSKPFNLKKNQRTTTVYRPQEAAIPPSPDVSVKESTREHFLKRLKHNIVRDKQIHFHHNMKKVINMKLEDKKIRDQLKLLNKREKQIQLSVREYHRQYKQYCRSIQQKYEINYSMLNIKLNKQIITLPSNKEVIEISSNKKLLIEEYKQFTDKIQLQLRKINYLINTKKQAIKKSQTNVEQNRIYHLLQEPIQSFQESQKQAERPIVQGPTYRQIMKARRNKNFSKARQIVQDATHEENEKDIHHMSSIQYKQDSQVYENQSGRIKMNHNLRNLLLH